MRFSCHYLLYVLTIFSVLSSCTANKEKAEGRGTAATDAATAEAIQIASQPAAAPMEGVTDSVSIGMDSLNTKEPGAEAVYPIKSENIDVDSLDVKEAGVRVICPIESKEKAEGKRPELSSEPNRGGSFVSFSFYFYFPQKRIMFREILFHSAASCSSFAKKSIEESYIDDIVGNIDGGFPEDWYSPKNFAEQKAAFENQSSCGKYEFLKLREASYLIACWQSEDYIFEAITFKGDTRIMIVMASIKKCEDDRENCLNLLSKFSLLPLNN